MEEEVLRDVPRYPLRPVTEYTHGGHRLSWGAVWAGVMIALGMEMLLSLFGLFIGFGMYNWRAANPWAGISSWTVIWHLVTAFWSMLFGAWCAARLSGDPAQGIGVLHGITVWGLAAIASITTLGLGAWSVLREGVNVLGTAALAGAQIAPTVNQVAPGALPQSTQQAAGQTLNQMQVAQTTASTISHLALLIWVGLLVGFIAAILGGMAGRPHGVMVEAQPTPGPTRLAA